MQQQVFSAVGHRPLGTTCAVRFLATLNQQAATLCTHKCTSKRAAVVAAAATDSNVQQHTPHVSVLLQEVLENLNHKPIKVPCERSGNPDAAQLFGCDMPGHCTSLREHMHTRMRWVCNVQVPVDTVSVIDSVSRFLTCLQL